MIKLRIDYIAIEFRYGATPEGSTGVDASELDGLRREINAPFLQVVGFEEIGRKQANFASLTIISLAGGRVGNLENASQVLVNVRELSLSDNLLWSWPQVASLGQSLPHLHSLNLSYNHLDWNNFSAEQLRKGLGDSLRRLVINGIPETDWQRAASVASALPLLETFHVAEAKVELRTIFSTLLIGLK